MIVESTDVGAQRYGGPTVAEMQRVLLSDLHSQKFGTCSV